MKSKAALLFLPSHRDAGVRFLANDISLVASFIHERDFDKRVIGKIHGRNVAWEREKESKEKKVYENCDVKFMITGASENEGALRKRQVHYNKRRVYMK